MAYNSGAKLAQAKASRKQMLYDLPDFPEDLPNEEKRNCVKAILFSLEDDLKQETNKWRRKELGVRKLELQNQLSALRPKKSAPGVERFFIEAARAMLTGANYNLLMTRAVELLREYEKTKPTETKTEDLK